MSKYISEFTSINGVNYKIEIQTETGAKTTNFILGGTPFVTSMDSDGKTIYSPIKTVGATITMLTKEVPFDLYTGKAQGTKATVTSGNNIIFKGYVTPCAYTQGFDAKLEELEIECVDGIAVLKEIPYKSTVEAHDMETFANIIFKCLKLSGCYKTLYITDNVQLQVNGNESVIEKFRISQQNFFDTKKDINQTDDDVAWTCYDVLFELMQWLGYTLFADGEEVFIIDYDAIKRGNNTYFKYDISGDKIGAKTTVTKKYSHYIEGGSYSENGTSISLDNVYNKVSVKDEFQTFDNIFPEFGDENFEQNITIGSEDIGMRYYTTNNIYFTNMVNDCFTETGKSGKINNYQIWTQKGWRNKMWVCIAKFFTSPVLEFKKYEHRDKARTEETKDYEKNMSLSRIWNAHGATYWKIWKREITNADYNKWRAKYQSNWQGMTVEQRKQAWLDLLNQDPSKISTLEPIITMYNENARNKIEYNEVEKFPYIRLKSENNPASFGGEGAYIIISGSCLYHDESYTPFPISDGANNNKLKKEGDWKLPSECYLPAMLKWGNYYWNEDGWQETYCTFPLRWRELTRSREEQKNKNIYDRFFEFIDTAQSKYGCTEKGVYIPVPDDGNLNGAVEFVIYANRDMYGKSKRSNWKGRSRYYSKVLVIKNLKIEAKISNGILDDKENDSDTVYTNIIDNGSISKLDEITFKVCTNDGKKPNYSSVDYLNGDKSVYVTKTINKALNSEEINTDSIESAFDNAPLLTQEEHLIFKLVSQYTNPKVVFEVNLHNDSHKLYGLYTDKTINGKTFIPVQINTDYRFNKQEIKLTEKF